MKRPKKMTIQEAKTLPLVDVLARFGCVPSRIHGASVWYLSPFREEKTASFKVNLDLNTWYDFGIGEGGTIIDLFMELENTCDISQVLMCIQDRNAYSVSPSPPLPKAPRQKTDKPAIQSVREISNPALIYYLEKERGLDPELVRLYASEIHYTVGKNSYIAIGHANEKGGFEIRQPNYKGTLSAKDISHFTGQQETGKIAVFEGLFDFLALLSLHKLKEPPHDSLILNSVALTGRACDYLEEQGFNEVNLYLDNDAAGDKAVEVFRERFEIVKDHSKGYLEHKDVNDLLLHNKAFERELEAALKKQFNR